ncbi:MAG: ATP-binding protein [Pseudonocardia sp.]|nr:ATP-binding protein [Pseudonocardia sp.]
MSEHRTGNSPAMPAAHALVEPTPWRLTLDLPAVATSCEVVRSRLRSWMTGVGCPSDLRDDIVLAVNEAVSNVVDHAYRGARVGSVRVCAALVIDGERRSRIAITVEDLGRWQLSTVDPARRYGGLAIIRACMDEVDIRVDVKGTHVLLTSTPIQVLPGSATRPAVWARAAQGVVLAARCADALGARAVTAVTAVAHAISSRRRRRARALLADF